MIIPVYKRLGGSTHQLAFQVGQLHQQKATHTGTLDPLAEGVVIVLTGDDRFRKSEFSNWQKTYEFSVIFGISTDSFDLMGKIQEVDFSKINSAKLKSDLQTWSKNLPGKTQQAIPNFSARRISGKSAFDFAKKGIGTSQKQEEIEVFSAEFLGIKKINSNNLIKKTIDNISQVKGDFRQKELVPMWRDTKLPATITSADFQVTTSKRTYVRGLVNSLGEQLRIPVTTSAITRTANGKYMIKDSICLV